MQTRHPSKCVTSILLRSALAPLLLAGVSAGCENYPLHELGYTSGELSAPEDPAAPAPPVARLASELAGVWIGTAEDPFALRNNADEAPPAFLFPSGSTRIRLELVTADGAPLPSGTLTFGEGTPPAPTDASVGYPIEPPITTAIVLPDASVRPPADGFAYSVHPNAVSREIAGDPTFLNEGVTVDGKLDLFYAPTEAFRPWCALQTAETCPSGGTAMDDDGSCAFPAQIGNVDCLKVAQCGGQVCTCPNDGPCWASSDPVSVLSVRLADQGLVGLFSSAVFRNERGFQQPLGTVHFRPANPGD
jgi:hypothetical protein